jgi:PAS domain S-box-containing protein
MNKPMRIRKALMASVSFFTLVPMLVAMAVSVVLFHLETSKRIRQENLKVAQTVANAVDLFLTRPVVTLKHVRDVVTANGSSDERRLQQLIDRVLEDDPLFESVQLLDANGRHVGMAGPEGSHFDGTVKKQDYSSSELFRKVRQTGRVAWSEPFVSLKSGESVISVAIPWEGGAIAGTMALSYLCKLVEPTRTASNAYAFIVSPAGKLIAHPDRALVGEKEAFISLPQITAGFQGTSGTYSFKLGERKVIGSVLPFAQNDWVIVSVHDKEMAFAPLMEMERLLALLALLVLAGALALVYVKIGKMTAPLLALTESSRQLAAGEEVQEKIEFSAYREIHDLYDNFQSMATAVKAREHDLQERNEELAYTEEELRHQVDDYLHLYNELLAEKNKLESILASMGEGLSIQDRNLTVVLQNNAHREMVGDFTGKSCFEMFDHGDAPCDNCPVQAAFHDGSTHTVLRQVPGAEGMRYLEVTASPLRDGGGGIVGGIEIVRDVTGRILSEQEIRRLNQELEERVIQRTSELEIANRELESFSYSVSHDLRAPLRHISSFSSILGSEHAGQLDDEGQHLLGRIIAGCDKMGRLIDDLLELSYVSSHELKNENVNLTRIARRIAAGLGEHAPQRQVRFEIAEDLTTYGDERLLEIVLNNLFGNAWKYTSRKEEGLIQFGVQRMAARPVFFIRDNGAGFDKSYADKLFTPFSRLHGQEFEGTGIGLAIVQRVIHRHGGKIWADSVEGEGATFYFTLR